MDSDNECPVCILSYNKSTRRKITCDKQECGQECCMSCFKTWVLDTGNDNPKCMSCNTVFDQTQLEKKITKTLRNQIFNHRANMLVSREFSLLGATQPDVIKFKRNRAIDIEIQELKKENDKLKQQIHQNKIRMERLRIEKETDRVEKERAVFNQPCPDTECRGFLSSAWKCNQCEKHYCKDCHKEKVEGHVCNDDDKATIAMIKKECKPCPKCFGPIFKLYGCDQMFCPREGCHTPFSWTTGKIITNGPIHNPHYFEVMRLNGGNVPRQPGDIPCGGVPGPWSIDRRCKDMGFNVDSRDLLFNCARLIPHITEVVIPKYPTEITVDTFLIHRIKYSINELTKKEWTRKLKMGIKKTDKNAEVVTILNCVVTVLTDILQRFMNTIIEPIGEINNIREYSNTHLKAIGKRYGNKSIQFNKRMYDIY